MVRTCRRSETGHGRATTVTDTRAVNEIRASGPGDSRAEENVILCFNVGSSSVKFSLYTANGNRETLSADGIVDRIALKGGKLRVYGPDKEVLKEAGAETKGHKEAIQEVFSVLDELKLSRPEAVGHRIVHGGPDFTEPVKVDQDVRKTLKEIVGFAPLHLPVEIEAMDAVSDYLPDLPQVACFDTAFHQKMPETARRLPLPRRFWDEGLRRYGFHGLSYEYILHVLGGAGRTVIAHLGNGASMAAVKNGQPMDTTMGFTPAGGFMMGTRCGDLDPGVLIYLLKEKSYDASGLEDLVNRKSGLLGVSGASPDMKTLLAKREKEPHAEQAVQMFCYQIQKQIGAFVAVLGGLDNLVFTGGIGEKAAAVRREICERLGYFGIELNREDNEMNSRIISAPTSACIVHVIPTKEDLMIARHTRRLVFELG
jgi:acetate kinase